MRQKVLEKVVKLLWRKKYLGNDKGFQNIIECIDYYEKIENDLINNNNLPEKLLKKYYPYAEYLD